MTPLNKAGKSDMSQILVWVVIFGVVAYAFNFGGFTDTVNGWLGDSSAPDMGDDEPVLTNSANCPSDGTSTFTLNVQDELASTATNLDAEYFVFNGNKLIKEGATGSDGTVDVDVACGKDYKLLLTNTTAGTGAGLYSKVLDMKARISEDTLNARLVRVGSARILGIENPADPSGTANATLNPGGVANFQLKFSSNFSNRGYNQPIILCQTNTSLIQKVALGSFSDGTEVKTVSKIPNRISASVGHQYYAWEYPKMLKPTDGVIVASGSITALSGAALGEIQVSSMSCILADQATWKMPDYKTAETIEAGFPTGPEDTENIADVGGPDAPSSSYNFIHDSGY